MTGLDADAAEEMTDIWIVVIEDSQRHEIHPFTSELQAIAYADTEVQALDPEDLQPEDRELNDAMTADGWVWYCRYSSEGDSVRVVRRKLRSA